VISSMTKKPVKKTLIALYIKISVGSKHEKCNNNEKRYENAVYCINI